MSLGWVEVVGFAVGLLLGSFLNVCIARVPRGESVVRPGSHCRHCGHAVRWFDNVPVLSWVWLRGRCRDCGDRYSWRYPAVELAVGLWFTAVVLRCFIWSSVGEYVQLTTTSYVLLLIQGVGLCMLGWLLIGLIVMDWQTLRLPDAFTLSGIAAGLFLVCVQAIFLGPTDDQVVLNTTHQLRMSSPGSFAAKGNVFLTGPEALIFGRVAAVCGGGTDSAGGALDLQGGAEAGRDGAGGCEAACDGGGVSGVLAGGGGFVCGGWAGGGVGGVAAGAGEGGDR